MFAAITVVIALLGLLLLGLSFMQGVALGAAATVLAVMFSALTIIPALIGGSGPFMDGVLHELDRRGGLRLWGTKRRIHLPGADWRARRAERRERRRAEAAGWERWSEAVQRRPWLAAAAAVAVLVAPGDPGAQHAPRLERRRRRPAGHHHARRLRPDRPGLRCRHQRLVPARRRAAPQGRQGRGRTDRRRGEARPRLHVRLAAGALTRRPGGDDHRLPADRSAGRGDDRHAQAPARRRRARRSSASTGATVEVGGFTASTEDFSRVVAGKLPLFVGVVVLFSALLLLVVFHSVVIPIKAALMNLLSIGAALGLRHADLPGGPRRRACSGSAPARSSPSCRC